MLRRGFLASLPFLPSAVKAALSPKPAVVRPSDFPYAGPRVWVQFNPQQYVGEVTWIHNPEWDTATHGIRFSNQSHGQA